MIRREIDEVRIEVIERAAGLPIYEVLDSIVGQERQACDMVQCAMYAEADSVLRMVPVTGGPAGWGNGDVDESRYPYETEKNIDQIVYGCPKKSCSADNCALQGLGKRLSELESASMTALQAVAEAERESAETSELLEEERRLQRRLEEIQAEKEAEVRDSGQAALKSFREEVLGSNK